jgi:hypothetical protein
VVRQVYCEETGIRHCGWGFRTDKAKRDTYPPEIGRSTAPTIRGRVIVQTRELSLQKLSRPTVAIVGRIRACKDCSASVALSVELVDPRGILIVLWKSRMNNVAWFINVRRKLSVPLVYSCSAATPFGRAPD